MDAVDYYNSGHRKMREQDYIGAVSDYTSAIYGDKSTAPDAKDLEIMAYLNRGIANYNYSLGKNKFSTEIIMKISEALSDWEKVLEMDSNPDRRAQTMNLIENLKQARDN